MSPDKKPTKPIDIYVRVSSVAGRDVSADGGTAAEQEKRCRAQLEAAGLAAGKIFTDLDVSGGKTSRPAFDRAKARIESGTSGGMIVLNLSRFGRNRKVDEDILALEALGGTVISVEERLDTSSPSGRFALTILSAVNTLYLEQVTEGLKRSHARRIRGGAHHTVPVGYARGKGGRLVPNGFSDVVISVFEARAAGASLSECAALLTEAGAKTRSHASKARRKVSGRDTWSVTAARGVLGNRAYLGEAKSGKTVVPGAHPALVDAATFALANRSTPRKASRGNSEGALLAGLCECATCSYALSPEKQRDRAGYAYYRCKASPACTARAAVSVAKLEPFVISAAVWDGTVAAADPALIDRTEELEGIRDEKAIAVEEFKTALGLEELPAGARPMIELAEAQTALDGYDIPDGARRFLRPSEFEELSVREQRAYLRANIEKVIVSPGKGPVEDRVKVVLVEGPDTWGAPVTFAGKIEKVTR